MSGDPMLSALCLDDASLASAFDRAATQIDEGTMRRAAESLTAWRDSPAHIFEPTTGGRCARCLRPREDH